MQFDTLFVELVDSTNMINALLAGISQDEARLRAAPAAWSILEVMCHLYDEEREDFREHLRFILNPQGEWHLIDPEGWVTERNYNARGLREMKEKFFAERSQSLDWLKSLEHADWNASYTTPYRTISAGEMFAPARIRLEVVSYRSWMSPDGSDSIEDMYQHVQSVPRGNADIVVALTAQLHGKEGGIAAALTRVEAAVLER